MRLAVHRVTLPCRGTAMANLVVSVLPFPPDSDALMLPRSAPTRRSFCVERWVHSSLGGAKGTSQAKARAAQLRCVFVAFHVKVRDVFVQLVAVGVENAQVCEGA